MSDAVSPFNVVESTDELGAAVMSDASAVVAMDSSVFATIGRFLFFVELLEAEDCESIA